MEHLRGPLQKFFSPLCGVRQQSDAASEYFRRGRTRQVAFLCYLILAAVPSPGASKSAEDEIVFARALSARGEYDSAIVSFQKASESFRTSRRDLYYLSIAGIADCYLRKTRFTESDSLLTFLERGVTEEFGERHKVTAEVYRLAGYLKTYQDRYDEAIIYNTRGLSIWTELFPHDSLTQASFQFGLGIAYLRKGEPAPAREWLSRAVESQSRYGRTAGPALVSTFLALGQTEDLLGNAPGSISVFKNALRLLDTLRLEGSSSAVTCRHFLAVELKKSGRVEEAISWERSALGIGRKIYGSRNLVLAGILAQMGDYCVLLGEFDAALLYYGEAHTSIIELLGPDHSSTHEVERKLARLYLLQGKPDTALVLYRNAIQSLTASFGSRNPGIASLFSEAGEASLAAGDARGALALFDRALALLPAADSVSRAEVFLRAGKALTAINLTDSAGSMLSRALALQGSGSSPNTDLLSATYEAVGNLREREGNLAAAQKMYDRALAELSLPGEGRPPQVTDPRLLPPASRAQAVRLYLSRANILKKGAAFSPEGRRRLDEALACYELAGATIAQSRESYRSEGAKLSAQKELEYVCGEGLALAERLLRRTGENAYAEKALNFAEQSRAGVLLEGLERSGRGTPGENPAGSVNALRVRAARLGRLIEWTSRYGEKRALRSLNEELVGIYNAIDVVEDSLARLHPGHSGEFPLVRTATVREIQEGLDPGSCLIQFSRGEERLFAFVIAKERFTLIPLGRSADADSVSGVLRRALRSLDRDAYVSSAQSLYARILRPLGKSIESFRHLIIAPTGGLSYVPFEALIAPAANSRPGKPADEYGSLRYLVLDHDVSYTLSGTFACRTRATHEPAVRHEMTFAGFAPVFSRVNAGGNEQQHEYLAKLDPLATRSITVDGREFSELPWSREEIRNIGEMFRSQGETALCCSEADATEERFKANAGRSGILHIATHGFINDEKPGLSALIFSPSHDSLMAEDGVLYAGEVYDMRLNADLVVLSSCESGVGKMAPGEGLMAMSRGFISAGAKAIAYSLWKVNDRQTGVLMEKFYRRLLRGEGYASALAEAKRAMIAGRTAANPYFWAGFVLMGR